ncbi:hypothetical protein LR48_Vigan148s002400 [Vigna angularis]|uniref:Uncharacterized protein n=1 Tax=Phaseolus angularis TaxID=3914 RepID=A0A0L9T4X9_PHAAN|nr:hypothetical protein LR48_Vigan148s002400 [Vigna angularis]
MLSVTVPLILWVRPKKRNPTLVVVSPPLSSSPLSVAICQAKLRVRLALRSATQPWWSPPQKPLHAPPRAASLRQVSGACSSCAAFSVSDRHYATVDRFARAS